MVMDLNNGYSGWYSSGFGFFNSKSTVKSLRVVSLDGYDDGKFDRGNPVFHIPY
jgi:hypothetical protein